MTKKEVIRDKLVNPTLYTYDYNLMNRLVRVVSHDGTATVYEYDELGNKKAVKHEGGLTISYKYDSHSRMINEIVIEKDSNVLMFCDDSYGNAGERTKSIEVVRNSSEDENCKVICNRYEYDKLLRLTKEVISIAENVKFSDVINTDVTANNISKKSDNNV